MISGGYFFSINKRLCLCLHCHRNEYSFQRNHFPILFAQRIIVFQNKLDQFDSIDTTNDRCIVQVFLRVLCVIRKRDEQAIIAFPHCAFQGLDRCFCRCFSYKSPPCCPWARIISLRRRIFRAAASRRRARPRPRAPSFLFFVCSIHSDSLPVLYLDCNISA